MAEEPSVDAAGLQDHRAYPKHELYGLVSQMRRAAVSVPANIAEGFKRRKNPDKARCMNIAQGSLEEVRYYFMLSRDLGYLKDIESDGSTKSVVLFAYIRRWHHEP